jgi:hypothetical protein
MFVSIFLHLFQLFIIDYAVSVEFLMGIRLLGIPYLLTTIDLLIPRSANPSCSAGPWKQLLALLWFEEDGGRVLPPPTSVGQQHP